MKILFLIRSLDRGGAERQLTLLAAGLKKAGHEPAVAVFYGGGLFENALRESGVPLFDLGKKSRWDLLGFLRRLAALVRQVRPDILHSYLVEPNLFSALLRPRLGGARVVWGVRASNMELDHYHPAAKLSFALSRRLSRRCDLAIFNSRAGLDFHRAQGYHPRRTAVVRNGIDARTLFKPDPDARSALRREWGVAPKQSLVGVVGRLDPMKDHRTFLEAAAQVKRARPETRFVCVGGGGSPDHETALRGHSERLGLKDMLIWAGPRDDMRAVYNALDLGVSSSAFGEGFSGAISEGMACGLPFVATDVGESAWIVGQTGLTAPPRDSAALETAILEMLHRIDQNPDELKRRARARIESQFSPEILVEKTLGVLEPLL